MLLGCAPAFLAAFDFGFMVLAGPSVGADVGAGGAYPWLFSASSFAYGVAVMPAAARLEPALGLRLGLALAAAGTTLLALAPALPMALTGRALFGLGGGIAAPAALATLAALEPAGRRRTAFSALGAAVALGFATGALVAASIPWRTALAATALTTLAAAATATRRPRPAAAAREIARPRREVAAGDVVDAIAARDIARPRGDTVARGVVDAVAARDIARPRRDVAAPVPRGATLFAAATLALALALAAPAWPGVVAGAIAAVGLTVAAVRWAEPWSPERRARTLAVLLGAAATTASGVGATVVLGRSLAGNPAAAPVLVAFGIAALPATRLAGRLGGRCAAAGLALQALGVAGVGLALAEGAGALRLAVAVAVFGAGHVLANAGVAEAAATLAGEHVAPVAGLLVTAQYAGAGTGALLLAGIEARHGPAAAEFLAAAIACAGALAVAATPVRTRAPA